MVENFIEFNPSTKNESVRNILLCFPPCKEVLNSLSMSDFPKYIDILLVLVAIINPQ